MNEDHFGMQVLIGVIVCFTLLAVGLMRGCDAEKEITLEAMRRGYCKVSVPGVSSPQWQPCPCDSTKERQATK